MLLSAIPLVVPVSLNGSAAMTVGALHVSPPPRATRDPTLMADFGFGIAFAKGTFAAVAAERFAPRPTE
jgi:hypothetical protein